jgi:hypothetical protein
MRRERTKKCRGCGAYNGMRLLDGKLFLFLECLACPHYCYVCVEAGRHDEVACLERWHDGVLQALLHRLNSPPRRRPARRK